MEPVTEQKENKNKHRFKGVENFLRRIAFNLGNTPSQTEVKIISCIPIDVTDLQQKIIQLERQLDGVQTAPKKVREPEPEPRKSTATVRKDSAGTSRKGSTATTRKDNAAKGDKDSVTNKSVKEAAEAKSTKDVSEAKNTKEAPAAKPGKDTKEPGSKKSLAGSQKKTSVVHTAFCDSNFDYSSTNASRKEESKSDNEKLPGTAKQRKSAVSFIFPAFSNCDKRMISSDENYIDNKTKSKNEFRKNLFDIKRKRTKKKNYNKTELVYYAETENLYNNTNNDNPKTTIKNITPDNRAYLNDIVQKQFKLGMILEKLSDSSEFSSPICRDEEKTFQEPCPYESDVCSCFRGPFQNIDYVTSVRFNHSRTVHDAAIDNRDAYYDSSLYDVVPVKEKPVKPKKNVSSAKRKVDIKCWPENIRTKPRFQPYVVKHHTFSPINDICKLYKSNNERYTKNTLTKTDRKAQAEGQMANDTSKSCCIDLGEIQMKKVNKKVITTQSESVGPVHKNAECVTTIEHKADCQTTIGIEDTNTLDKTEETLNNIKSILRSVLAEVKTNTQIKQAGDNTKKDAVVQKGVSQSNLQVCSRLLNCLTYSPFNVNPCDATCSRLMPPGHPYCAMQQHPMKCMHNYPVFIQSAGRRRCSNCFQSSNLSKYPTNNVTAATNTEEIKQEQNKETEKLIKEIYRSMALTTDFSKKDASCANHDHMKALINEDSTNESFKSNNVKGLNNIISEIFRKPSPETDTSVTQDTVTTLNSKIISNCVSVQSQGVSTDEDQRDINRHGFIEEDDEDEEDEDEVDNDDDESIETDKDSLTELNSAGAPDQDTESNSNESESENIVTVTESVKKNKKPSLLSKMFKTVFKTKEKKTPKVTVTKSESSDSDDYQTIYSHRVEDTPQRKTSRSPKKPHSKIIYARQRVKSPEKCYKRTPYMEQEYRRHWNEKLLFKDKARRYSSEQPYSFESRPRRPLYYQNYDARSLMVEPNRFNTLGNDEHLSKYTNNGTSYHYNGRPNWCRYQIQRDFPNDIGQKRNCSTKVAQGSAWLDKHKMGIHCGQQWKKLIIEG